jgi:hypothetical protein
MICWLYSWGMIPEKSDRGMAGSFQRDDRSRRFRATSRLRGHRASRWPGLGIAPREAPGFGYRLPLASRRTATGPASPR